MSRNRNTLHDRPGPQDEGVRTVDHRTVRRFLTTLATRPELVSKDAQLDPLECLVLGLFRCEEGTEYTTGMVMHLAQHAGVNNSALSIGLPLARLVHKGYAAQGRLAGQSTYSLTHAGHAAEHAFLKEHWSTLEAPARVGCGLCGAMLRLGYQ